MTENLLVFGDHGNLIGVLTPPLAPTRTAVILLDAGLIHRVGPGRLHVRMARTLAERGFATLRFDFSGVGDSPWRPDDLTVFEVATREPSEAMNALSAEGYDKFVVAGLCSGAVAALMAALHDPRVAAVVAINPPALYDNAEAETQALANRYLKRSIFSPRAWFNLLTGRVKYKRLFRTLLRRKQPVATPEAETTDLPDIRRCIATLIGRGGRLTFLLSEQDTSVDHVGVLLGQDLRRRPSHPDAEIIVVPGAAHLLFREADKVAVIDAVVAAASNLSR